MSITPRAAELKRQVAVYLNDVTSILAESSGKALSSAAFADIYHIALSADTVLHGLARPRLQPSLNAARSIALRLPLLAGVGQQSIAMVELRRFLELTCWTIYFSDHPVEWQSFNARSGIGFARDTRKPISYAAHRELAHYVEYVRELMDTEESGLAVAAVDGLKQVSHDLNAAVHAGQIARSASLKLPHDNISEPELRKFGAIARKVFLNSCIVLAAYNRKRFDGLSAAGRAHFDWLVGPAIRKKIRQGPFGLPMA